MEQMEIKMARGDLERIPVRVKDQEDELFDDIYFTVKNSNYEENYLFQKRLSDGSIIPFYDGRYFITIYPEDTNGMMYGEYKFDIELVIDGVMKKTFPGIFKLTKETTFAGNEGV